jgi:sarcosine oxidase
LRVEECVQAHLDRAQKLGAHLFLGETVRVWTDNGKQVSVRTDRGEYSANRLIVAAGPWSGNLLVDLKIPLAVVRKPLYWFPIKEGHADVYTQGPGFYFERGSDIFYGFPSIDGQTVKLAEHSGGEPVSDPGTLDRNSFERDERVLSAFVTDVLPGLDPQPVRHSVCMYTHTPDGHFIVDRHPEHENVVIGAGFSGHGFKFTSALGKALAEMAIDGKTAFPVGFLSLGRAGL